MDRPLYAGVDYIGSGQLSRLGGRLTENAAGGGGHCATPAPADGTRTCTLAQGDVPVMSRPDPHAARVDPSPASSG